MKTNIFRLAIFLICVLLIPNCTSDKKHSNEKEVPLSFIPFHMVDLQDSFWSPRLRIQKEVLVPFALEKTKPAVENLYKAGKFLKGDTTDLPFPHRYISSDLYKVMEGAALLLQENPDPKLEARMDSIIDIIGAAQKEDGYLYVAHITGVAKEHSAWGGGGMGDKPYSWVIHSHELYNMGHMYEAAIAYYRSTGKDKWLRIAEKNAQHINRVFFEGDPDYNEGKPVLQAPGHQELELALVKLYQVTNNPLYLEMAQKFLDIRGKTYIPEGDEYMSPTYSQQHLPVEDQTRIVGHAVRAMYQFSGMADVGAALNTHQYDHALESVWHDITDKKMHITGGLGAMHGIEGFGPDFYLPNKEAYNETCAAVGNVFFNIRMFLLTRNARYMDVAEIALLNNVLAGVNLEGNRFFYVNPLESDGITGFNHGKEGRSPWFGTACCPSNLARLIPQIPGMIYAHDDHNVFVTFFAGSSVNIPLAKGDVQIVQETNYPFEGNIEFHISPSQNQQFSLHLRIPTWAQNQIVPGELYHYKAPGNKEIEILVNDQKIHYEIKNGFAIIDRIWTKDDLVTLKFEMAPKVNIAIDSIEADRGRIAISRGPLIYCVEGIDHKVEAQSVGLLADIDDFDVEQFQDGVLRGIPMIKTQGWINSGNISEPSEIKLVPYYAWNNRGNSSMAVWIKRISE